MSKQCAICGKKINFVNEEKLCEEYPHEKICFSCYEYVATAHKGNVRAMNFLKSSYKEDISSQVKNYINSIELKSKIIAMQNTSTKNDEFMDLLNGTTSDQDNLNKSNLQTQSQFIDPKLSESKIDKLIRLYALTNILFGIVILGGFLLSFYIYTQAQDSLFATFSFVVTIVFSLILFILKSFINIFIEK